MKKGLWVLLILCAMLVSCDNDQIQQRDDALERVFRGHPYEMSVGGDKLYDYYLTTTTSTGKRVKIAVFYGMGNNLTMCQAVAMSLPKDETVNSTPRDYDCEPAN